MAGEIKALTGLRGVAASAVMIDHYAAVDFRSSFPLKFLPHMYVAVDMFMILSGFVLALTYEPRFAASKSIDANILFFRSRLARLYPLYLGMTLVCFLLCRDGCLTFLSPNTSLAALGANLLGVQTWIWPGTSLDGPAWSISAEWAANFLFPVLMTMILSGSLLRGTAVIAVAIGVLWICAFLFGSLFEDPVSGVVNIISGPQALGRCVSEFAIGIYLWRLRSRVDVARVLSSNGVQFALLAIMLVVFIEPKLDVVFVLMLGLLILGLSYDASKLARILGSGIAYRLGVISYSIYLVHIALLPVRDMLADLFGNSGVPYPWCMAVCCTATAAIGLSIISYRFIERPGQRLIRSAFTSRAGSRSAKAVAKQR